MEYQNVKEIPVKIVGSIDNLKKQYQPDEDIIGAKEKLRAGSINSPIKVNLKDVKYQLEKAIEPLLNQVNVYYFIIKIESQHERSA